MKKPLVLCVLSMLVSFLSTTGAVAEDEPYLTKTALTKTAQSLTFDIGDSSAQLRIKGPGDFFLERSVEGAMSLDVGQDFGAGIVDGHYRWEIRPLQKRSDAEKSGEDAIYSGSFRILGGALLGERGMEEREAQGRAEKTIVQNDDVAIIGALCVGDKCTGAEVPTATQMLKSNNNRLLFLDASTSASYPSDNWQLVANDTNFGGENRFSIENSTRGQVPFTVREAPDHSLYIDSDGDIGFGTSTPSADLHVMSRDTPKLRLEQDGSAGFSPYSWEVAGNEGNFFVRDGTAGRYPFRIKSGAPENSLVVRSNGFVGVGTNSASTELHVVGAVTADALAAALVETTSLTSETVEIGGWQIRSNGAGELQFSQASGGAFVPILKLNSRGEVTPISTEIAESDPGTASSENPLFPAYDAFDFDPSTAWQSLGAGPHWLGVDLGSMHLMDRATLHWGTEAAETYAIQVSEDGLDWSTVYSNIAGDGGTDTFSISGRGRYLRMWIPSTGTEAFTVTDFEVYGRPDWTP